MDSERWNKINELFLAWLDLEGDEQSRFLTEACGDDAGLRKELQLLIAAHLQADHFIETPVFNDAARVLADEGESLEVGQKIGSYKILKEIGRGGMGAVYLAERADEHYRKQVAIKLIKRGMDTDQVLRHFHKERQILAGFDHPNIARLLDGGSTESGLPYFVMEYVEGRPMDRYCDENSLSITNRLDLFRQVCAAVSYAHRNLVIHRDLKPGNILVTAEGVPKLLDFGIAKILQPHSDGMATSTGLLPMTPEYASPEQATGANVNTLSDVYSLGIVLYELLTGHSPYQVKTAPASEIARIITETKPHLPSTMVNAVVEEETSDGSRSVLTPELVSKSREGSPERLRRRLRGDLDNIVLMALRKEPQRRYQSVEQFSEDIRRHLEGLPVIARKDTLIYRGTKFIQRNKVAVAFAVLAFISIGIAGMIRWRANLQAKSFQEFGQEVTRMEAIMRYAYLLPLHDIQPEKKDVAQRLEQVKSRMQVLGGQANGPGYYSLGRGYLALHRYQDAYDHLIQAWQKYSYREAPVANALGLSLAMLYQEKLQEAEQLYGKQQLTSKKAQLEKQYRDPALEYIQFGASASEEPEYVKALIAFLEKRYAEALKETEAAAQKRSWFYEGKALQGQILAAMGNDQRDIGKTDLAIGFYDEAKAAFLAAAKKGQSDPQVYEGLCSLQAGVLRLQMLHTGISPEAAYREGISYCESALAADPQYIPAHLTAAKSHIDWGYYQGTHGQELKESAMKALQAGKAVLQIDPGNAFGHLMVANAYSNLVDEELQKEENPISHLDLGDASYAIAVSINPGNAKALYNQGQNFERRGFFEISTGKDPRASLEKAASSFKKAIAQNPKELAFYAELGNAYWIKARYEIDTGVDASVSLQQAIQFSSKTTEMNPSFTNGYVQTAAAYLLLADSQTDRGENPIPALDQSITTYEKSLAMDPQNAYSLAGIGESFYKKGRWQYQHGENPEAMLDLARDALQKTIHFNKNLLECYSVYAEVELLAARNAIGKHQNPEPFFKKSEAILGESLAMNPKTVESLGTLALLHALRADYYSTSHQPADAEIQHGIEAADRAIAANPQVAEAHATRGKLHLMRARLLSGAAKGEAASTAEASFLQAIKIKSNLKGKYAAELEEAKRLAQ